MGVRGPTHVPAAGPTEVPTLPTATRTSLPATALPAPTATPRPLAASPTAPPTAGIPVPPGRDVYDLAERLRPAPDGTAGWAYREPRAPLAQGDSAEFWVHRDDGPARITATVLRASEHAYWVFEDAAGVNEGRLDDTVRKFEETIWPVVTSLFGNAWATGTEGDPRVVILHSSLRTGVAGYYSSADEYPRSILPRSNERQVIYVNPAVLPSGSDAYLAVLAHELQHAAHWAADPDEETWLNEGLSEVTMHRAGFPPPNVRSYLRQPATSLTGWPADVKSTGPHYGAAALFVEYLVTHYGGDDAMSRLLQEPADGLDGVDAYLRGLGAGVSALGVFADWLVANYLDDTSERYSYADRSMTMGLKATSQPVVASVPIDNRVGQFGARYYALRPRDPAVKVTFQGSAMAELFPAAPPSGRACWWGSAGDSIDTTLTRDIDLREVDSATLRWKVWHDIEADWDYAYVEASGDGGRTWDILAPLHATESDPNRAAYGAGYTGRSGEWLADRVDLSAYAGGLVFVRFEYVTDDAVHLDGVCLDDFEVPEIGWSDDAETDGGWVAEGFVRVNNRIRQEYLVQIVSDEGDDPITVERLQIARDGTGETTVTTADGSATIVVIVSAVTAASRTDAPYTLTIEPIP